MVNPAQPVPIFEKLKIFKKKSENIIWRIKKKMTYESFGVVYILECEKCGNRYIGSTIRQLKHSIADQRS